MLAEARAEGSACSASPLALRRNSQAAIREDQQRPDPRQVPLPLDTDQPF
ncbi:MAG: hypothetical protein R3E68_00180 [Burkholderiaceae bacterium]